MRCAKCDNPMRRSRADPTPVARMHNGRGLCWGCYASEKSAGRIADWPPTRGYEPCCEADEWCDFCTDVQWMADTHESPINWPGRLDLSPQAIQRKLERHHKKHLAKLIQPVVREIRNAAMAS